MALDEHFQEYFAALDRAGNEDRCYLCRRTPAEVKMFFGFDEDGVPIHASEFGIEDVVFDQTDIMSYRGTRPVCSICQLNYDAIFALDDHEVVYKILREMETRREELWPSRK